MQQNSNPNTPPTSVATAYRTMLHACKAMVSAQHAGPITPEMYVAWDQAQHIVKNAEAKPVIQNIVMMQQALEVAEQELCTLGALLTEEGWETWTIKLALDVVRIALYGGDGDGQGPEHFTIALAALKAQNDKEEREAACNRT